MTLAITPYQPRAVRFLDLWEIGTWRLKAYGIAYAATRPGTALIHAARDIAQKRLVASAEQTRHYGVGFVGIHAGKTGNFVFVDWWADENELHHHVYTSTSEHPHALVYQTPTGLTACTWDLFLIGHERDAWVNNILAARGTPDLEGYLSSRFNGQV